MSNEKPQPDVINKDSEDTEYKKEDNTDKPVQDTSTAKDSPAADLHIHSANSWETADLGDSKRNEKFLRLMGAAKKEHHGKFVIGDHDPVHTRKKKDNEQLKEDLAEQYEQSLEHRLESGPKGHLGLGFHPEEKTEKTDEGAKEESEQKDKKEESTEKTDDDKSEEREDRKKEGRQRKSSDSPVEEKKIKFVKSS